MRNWLRSLLCMHAYERIYWPDTVTLNGGIVYFQKAEYWFCWKCKKTTCKTPRNT